MIKPRNPHASEVRSPKYRQRIVKSRKGKGSYDRNKHKGSKDPLDIVIVRHYNNVC